MWASRRTIALAAVIMAWTNDGSPVYAANTLTTINQQIAAATDEVDAANTKVAAAMHAYTRSVAELAAANSALERANAAAKTAQAADRQAAADLLAATQAMHSAETRLAATGAELTKEQRLVTLLVAEAYRDGPVSQFDALLRAQDPSELISDFQTLQTWTTNKAHLIRRLTALKQQRTEDAAQLAAAQATQARQQVVAHRHAVVAAAALAAAQVAQKKVDAAKAASSAALITAKRHQKDVVRALETLKAEQARLKAQARKGAKLGAGLIFTGELVWPVTGGQLSQKSGPRIHPVFGYKSCHTGVDISGSTGTAIRAAASGVVVSTINGGAYGMHTLIAHGSGLTTMYAHQSRFAVQAGQSVQRGQVIGYVGSTGWSTGPHLHFEVRIDGTAYDPLGWFGGSKTAIQC